MPLVPLLSPEPSLPEGLFSDSGGGVGGNMLRLIGACETSLSWLLIILSISSPLGAVVRFS